MLMYFNFHFQLNRFTGLAMNVFMLGALGIMRAIRGYAMSTAFKRVHHAYCLNRFNTCCALT